MRIAFVSTVSSGPWGGSEELWHQCAEEALKLQHEIGVFVYDWQDEPLPIRQLRDKGAAIFKRSRYNKWQRRVLIKLVAKLGYSFPMFLNPYKELQLFKPDVIVITDGGMYYAADDGWLTKVLAEFKRKYIILSQGNGPYQMPADRRVAIEFFKDAKYVGFVAEHNKRLTFHQLAYALQNTFVIQNPVKLHSWECSEIPACDDGVIHCAVVGRFFVSDKGQDILVEMMSEDYWRKLPVVLHLFGSGKDKEYLQDLIKFYKVEKSIIIENFANIVDIWKKCHCLLMPSLLEGTPLTMLEALIIGRICIVTKVGGNDEWIVDGETGFLVDAPTKELFSAKLKQAISLWDKWPAMAREGHLRAIQKLDKNPGKTLLGIAVSNSISVSDTQLYS